MSSDCVFCTKIRDGMDKHRPAPLVVSFMPLNPVTQGHMLFVPIEHIEHASEGNLAVARAVEQAISYARNEGIEAYNIIQSNGAESTQTVPHAHVHLVPRREGDGLMLPWTQSHVTLTYYRAVTEDGKMWVESKSRKEVLSRSAGAPGPVTYQKLEDHYVPGDWQDWDPYGEER